MSLDSQFGGAQLSKLASYGIVSFNPTVGSSPAISPVTTTTLHVGPGRNIEPTATGFTFDINQKVGLFRLQYVLFVRNLAPTPAGGETFRFRTSVTTETGTTTGASVAFFPGGVATDTAQRFPAQLYFTVLAPRTAPSQISFSLDATSNLRVLMGNAELVQLPTPLNIDPLADQRAFGASGVVMSGVDEQA